MGGSLAAAIRRSFPGARILGVSRRLRTLSLAKRKRLIDEGSLDLSKMAPKADFVFVCSPVDTIPEFIKGLHRYGKKGAVVTDVGSTKAEIVKRADCMGSNRIHFVGSHPLAGSHETGIQFSDQNLYREAVVFVTPGRHTNRNAVQMVVHFWKKLKTKVMMVSPEVHDKIVSEISHLPHAVATLLVNSVSSKTFRYGASGFLDTTRIAQGDPCLWLPIFKSNKTNLLKNLGQFRNKLDELMVYLKSNRYQPIKRILTAASSRRRQRNES